VRVVVVALAFCAIAPPAIVEPVLPPVPATTAEPPARGGHATVIPSRGGHAVVVLAITVDLERLGVASVRELPRFPAWVCIHEHEGAWNDTGDPFWGGLQMDRGFMSAYGADFILEHAGEGWGGLGYADAWTPAEQIVAAERAYATRGFAPWPNTRKPCGV
jgi:hypothetical protein